MKQPSLAPWWYTTKNTSICCSQTDRQSHEFFDIIIMGILIFLSIKFASHVGDNF